MELDGFRRKLSRALAKSQQILDQQSAKPGASSIAGKRLNQAKAAAYQVMTGVVRPRLVEFMLQLGVIAASQNLETEDTIAGGAKYRCPITADCTLAVTLEPGRNGRSGELDLRIAVYSDGHVVDRPGIITIRADDRTEDDEIGSWIEYQLVKRVEQCVLAKSRA